MDKMKSNFSPSLIFALKEGKISWQAILRSLVIHVFFPKHLPQEEEPFKEEIVTALLSLLASVSERFSSEDEKASYNPRTSSTMRKWTKLRQELLAGTFALNKELSHLQVGATIPIYIGSQNCTILFTKLDEEHMRVMTFRASLPNEVIMSTAGSLQVSYPETVEVIPISKLLLSPIFSKHIRNLSFQTCSLVMPVSEKAGKKFPESRQVSNPFIISEFMVGMLQPIKPEEYNETMKQWTAIKITKKVRDEVNWDDCAIPFRRSGLWMSAKVILQLCLQEELGNEDEAARLAYKIILANFLIEICKEFIKGEPQNWDIMSQMMVKLANRARKLSELPNPTNRFENERKSTLETAFVTIKQLYSLVQADWKNVQFTPNCEISLIHLSEAEKQRDIQHNMTALNEYLAKPRLPNESTDVSNLQELNIQRHPSLALLLSSHNSVKDISSGDIHMNPKTVWIYDVELFIRDNMDGSTSKTATDIYTLFCIYIKDVVNLYAEDYWDPVSFSRMILTALKMIRILDEIAVQTHPLLKEYHSGIEPIMFNNLTLPQKKEDMEMLESLVDYFTTRNQEAKHPNIIQKGSVSWSDFSVQYAQQCKQMTELKIKILADTQTAIERKHDEVRRVKAECDSLQKDIRARPCEYRWDGYYEQTRHYSSCRRCKLIDELEKKRKSVKYYQRPLPNYDREEYLQDAVVFELLIPEEIAYLRNSLATFLGGIFAQNLFNGLNSNNIYINWNIFPDLAQYNSYGSTAKATVVKLGSSRKSTMATHYGKENPDVVLQDGNAFVVDNGLDCIYYSVPFLQLKLKSDDVLTFQLKNTTNCKAYENLQSSMCLPRPIENKVLASQIECHEKLSLQEFIPFGSMRIGHRIQLRDLLAALSNQNISLDQEPVLALILQTIWEVGPKGKGNLREIHTEFYEEGFSLEFLELLEKILKSNATNWSCPMVIIAITMLTIRILELNGSHDVRQFCSKILKFIRVTLESWWLKLETIILKDEKDSKNESAKDVEIVNELLLQTAICSAHTYNVCSEHLFKYIIIDHQDVVFWLSTVSRLYHMVVREKSHKNFSKFLLNLLRAARLSIPFNIEKYLHQMILKMGLNTCLHDYVSIKWAPAEKDNSSSWKRYNLLSTTHVYEGSYNVLNQEGVYEGHTVFVDVVRGIFLVDGYPPSYLPENVIQHKLFNRFFKHCRFQVQRDSKTFTTKNKYMERHYKFYFTKDGELIIQEVGDNNFPLELVPPQLLKEQISNHFIDDFTHWYNHQTNRVDFRNRSKNDTIDYNFCSERKLLMEHRKHGDGSSNRIFSINSEGFQRIVKNLSRLEYEEFIDVSLEESKTNDRKMTISVSLRRVNLTFVLENGILYSRNFPGYYVTLNQCLGTLTGLKSGLLLEMKSVSETSGFKKLLLVQHGHIQINNNGNTPHHQIVCVDSTSLRTPPLFTFEVDQILNRLKAGNDKSAWLYLAALHASTSSPFPDEFTGLTGTEMAMWILQSGFIFSCSPYDKECLRTFKMIHSLSPLRVYYPQHLKQMQTIRWPSGLEQNSYAAFDGFGIIVDNLIECSNRLEGLFPRANKDDENSDNEDDEVETSPELRERSYFRHLNTYNQVAHLGNTFMKGHSHPVSVEIFLDSMMNPSKEWMQIGKVRMAEKLHLIPGNANIESLIMTSEHLPSHPDLPPENDGKKPKFSWEKLNDWFSKTLREKWLHLYTLALHGQQLEHEFTFILGALLYFEKGTLEQALNLHNISHLASSTFPVYQFPSAFGFTSSFVPTEHNYVHGEVNKIVKQATKEFPDSEANYAKYARYEEAKTTFERERKRVVTLAGNAPSSHWPSIKIEKWILETVASNKYLDLNKIHEEINNKFSFWYNNLQLKLFVNKVDVILQIVRNAAIISVPLCHIQIRQLHVEIRPPVDADQLGKPLESMMMQAMDTTVSTNLIIDIEGDEKDQRQMHLESAKEIFENLKRIVQSTSLSTALDEAGIYSRLAPVVLLRKLLETDTTPPEQEQNGAKNLIIELGICFSNMRRLSRILRYKTSDIYSVELERELESQPFENWSPFQNPEWLLLELELNVTIRGIQVRVAEHMMDMSSKGVKNGVTQLNMGEGKTSIICPQILSALSSKQEDILCRVTVLSSIFTTNFNLLTFTIGGLLNKRLYTVPCRRDYRMCEYLSQIQETNEECMKLKGVIMTLPEYRLSFRLMYHNYYLQQKHGFALQVYKIESWLRQHVRDIVDESDEIFSVKYQLIYTTGNQLKIGGGSLRWTVCQKLLQILPEIACNLFEKFGESAVEFNKKESADNPEQFTPFRVLSTECKNDLYNSIADAVLQGKIDLVNIILTEQRRELVKAFLIDEHMSEEDHNTVMNMEGLDEEMKEILLIISGYLRHGVLFTALTKRWRVECGVNGQGDKLMAVPFRAKDIAAERTEFGHPDMAIVLTQLHYYYSGLNDDQLLEAFSKLKKLVGPESLYNGWIQKIPAGKVHDSVKTYKGINLLDFEQRTKHLFPILTKQKAVIDFWLENFVYPKESKQFPRKLVMNSWDLSYERQSHPTTGFSGTNDSKELLPANITQNDLEELQKTNEQLEATLQRSENGWKRSLAMSATCETILEYMKADGLRVLIDAGALVLDGNEAVANQWLQTDPTLEGVVYFNDKNQLVIKTRSNQDLQLKLSPYNDNLENCAVYLDDYHTRGTDLKLPNNFMASVTIGSRMRRDKLMQACMRMRKLGKGQSVHFYLSRESNNKIIGMKSDMHMHGENLNQNISVFDILAWVKENSKEFEEQGLIYWAASAKNYTQKLAAEELFKMSNMSEEDGEMFAKRCEDEELLTLEEIYGTYRSKQKLVDIIPKWFSHVNQSLIAAGTTLHALPDSIEKLVDDYEDLVRKQCEKVSPTQEFLFSMLEEEQEKELEPEAEEEINVERSPAAEALDPKLHQNVQMFIKRGGQLCVKPGILRLSDIFKNTTFWDKIQSECWGTQFYVTEDFVNVVVHSSGSDCFLRPMTYIASWSPHPSLAPTCLLLLSRFEVNELMPLFWSQNETAATLHMFSARFMEGQDTLVNKARLQLPIARRGVVLNENMMAPLLIAAGNLFYASMEEQKAFAKFLGIHPRPWKSEDEIAFESGLITGTGFVLPNNPDTVALRQDSLFQQDPTGMVMVILKCRNDVVRDSDHTKQLLSQRAYIEELE